MILGGPRLPRQSGTDRQGKPSPAYADALAVSARLHKMRNKFNGRYLFRYLEPLAFVVHKVGAATMLDYGCGKGTQYPECAERLGVTATLYDPAWAPFAQEPAGTFDIVIATQVLGAVPALDHSYVLARMYDRASKAIFVAERIRASSRKGRFYRGLVPEGWTADHWLADIAAPPRADGVRLFFSALSAAGLQLWELHIDGPVLLMTVRSARDVA